MTQCSQNVIFEVIESMLTKVDNKIEQNQVNTYIPSYLGAQISMMVCSNNDAMQYSQPLKTTIRQENISQVPCIGKDTLMPKQLQKEVTANEANNSVFNVSFTTVGKKKPLYLSKRASLQLSSRGNSLLLTERKSNRRDKSENTSQQNPFSLVHKEIEVQDPEIQKYRSILEIHLQHELQTHNITLQHQKRYKEKMEQMNSLDLGSPNSTLTYDYNGEQLKSIFVDDKIKYYSARAGVGPSNKRFKDGNKTYVPPEATKIQNNKYIKQKQARKQLRQMQMPLFPQPRNAPRLQGFKSYRRNEYKKHFGKGYSRFDQIQSTLDYTINKDDPNDEIFSQKKHLSDSQHVSRLSSSLMKHSNITRRIALPKLHGTYKVLDRYQQHLDG